MSSQIAAQWVSAIGSAGSLLGFAAYVLIMLLNRKDQAEVRQEQQAQGVASWLAERDGADEGEHSTGTGPIELCVHNGGQTPVFNVQCLFSLPSSNDQHSIGLSLIPPATTARRGMPFDPEWFSREELYSAPAVPEMRFTDSHGTNWQRDGDGKLLRLDRRTLRCKPAAGAESDDRDDSQWEREHRERTGDTRTQHNQA